MSDPKVNAVTIGFPLTISYGRWQRFLAAVMAEVEREECLVNIQVHYPGEQATVPVSSSLPPQSIGIGPTPMWAGDPRNIPPGWPGPPWNGLGNRLPPRDGTPWLRPSC